MRPLGPVFLANFSEMADLSGKTCIFVNEITKVGLIYNIKGDHFSSPFKYDYYL